MATTTGLPSGYKPPKTFGGADDYFKLNPVGNLGTNTATGAAGQPAVTWGLPPGQYAPNPGAGQSKTFQVPGTDPQSQIFNDPAFQALKNLLSAQGISDAAHLRGAIQQALIQFGSVPDLPQDVLANSGLDTGATSELAKNNPFSVLSRLAQSYQDQQDASKNQLAARGILSSGETGYQLGRLGQAQAGAQYDATNNLLGNIGSLNDTYAAGRQAAAQQLANGALTAENTVAQNGGGQASTVTATWDPATGTYVDVNGGHYDPSGNPVALPTGDTTPPPATANFGGGLGATTTMPQDTYTPSAALGSGTGARQIRSGV